MQKQGCSLWCLPIWAITWSFQFCGMLLNYYAPVGPQWATIFLPLSGYIAGVVINLFWPTFLERTISFFGFPTFGTSWILQSAGNYPFAEQLLFTCIGSENIHLYWKFNSMAHQVSEIGSPEIKAPKMSRHFGKRWLWILLSFKILQHEKCKKKVW